MTRVLIVDDNEAVQRELAEGLRMAGLEVVGHTGDPAEALRLAQTLRPQVVLVEVKRADGQGLALCQKLTSLAEAPSVVVFTSYADGDEMKLAHQAGVREYLLKSIDSGALARRLRALG